VAVFVVQKLMGDHFVEEEKVLTVDVRPGYKVRRVFYAVCGWQLET
jgi:hypothetical protein